MKSTAIKRKWTGPAGSIAAVALVACLAAPSALAKKGGKPGNGGGGDGGGGGGDTVTVNPVPDLVVPPISYTAMQLPWNGDIDGNGQSDRDEADFNGVTFGDINNQGIAVGYIAGPGTSYSSGAQKVARIVGGINFDPSTGEVAAEMFDLNEIFAASVAALNSERTDGPWRIGYGRAINEDGLVGLELLPDSEPYIHDETVPRLLAVADLSRRILDEAIMVIPSEVGGNDYFWQLTPAGDVLVFDVREVADDQYFRVFPLKMDAQGEPDGYSTQNEMPTPSLHWWNTPSISDAYALQPSPELLYARNLSTGGTGLIRYTYAVESGATEEVLHERSDVGFEAEGLVAGGGAYLTALERETTGKGRNKETISYTTSYHIVSPTERTPLTEPLVSARIPYTDRSVSDRGISDAWNPGEEEVLIEFDADGELQVYKPNFGARFTLPIDPGSHRFVEISAPVNQNAITTGPSDYAAGYVGYSTEAEPDRVIVLTPDGAPVPGD